MNTNDRIRLCRIARISTLADDTHIVYAVLAESRRLIAILPDSPLHQQIARACDSEIDRHLSSQGGISISDAKSVLSLVLDAFNLYYR